MAIAYYVRVTKSEICFILFLFLFLIYFLVLNLELEFSVILYDTVTKCHIMTLLLSHHYMLM